MKIENKTDDMLILSGETIYAKTKEKAVENTGKLGVKLNGRYEQMCIGQARQVPIDNQERVSS